MRRDRATSPRLHFWHLPVFVFWYLYNTHFPSISPSSAATARRSYLPPYNFVLPNDTFR